MTGSKSVALLGTLIERWEAREYHSQDASDLRDEFVRELEAALPTLQQDWKELEDCNDEHARLFREANATITEQDAEITALKKSLALPPAPPQGQESVCTCGTDNPLSARHKHNHLAWCALAASPPAQAQEPATTVILRCVDCGHKTTPEEAFYRVFNACRCGDCGGAFRVAHVSKSAPPAQGWHAEKEKS